MPLIDLPLPELQRYAGRNPRPADFDSYWTAALRELDATDPRPELRPSKVVNAQGAECYDLWFTGAGGARVYAKYLRPRHAKNAGKRPAVLQFHGYSGNSGDWLDKLAWVGEGFCYAAMDCRGQGGLSEDNLRVKGPTLRGHIVRGLDDPDPHQLAFRQIFLDTVQLARVVMGFAEVDAARVGCWGASKAARWRWPARRWSRASAAPLRCIPSSATISASGNSTRPRTRTRSCGISSAGLIRATSAPTKSSRSSATSIASTWRPASGRKP
jgi:cephalosporin-C deacetylase-like acetyl esterase